MKRLAIIGSTGSIGTQTLEIVSECPDRFVVDTLAAGRNVDLLIQQAQRYRPSLAIIADETLYPRLKEALEPLGIATAAGAGALADAMERDTFDMVVTATVGYSGLTPTIRAIKAGKDIALANKETLVVGGQYITGLLQKSPSRIFPVDSEHSAIYQCLQGEDKDAVKRLIITASGGPFRNHSLEQLKTVTVDEALCHPNWSMGAKITIDSATMINKAFEIIEAHWLFGVAPDRIKAVVHPQSVVHSMVEFVDGAIKAQLGVPDMHLPIRYALGEATRMSESRPGLTVGQMSMLTFEEPDEERFPGITLAKTALERGGNAACVINAANEIANAAFRERRLNFTEIYPSIMHTLEQVPYIANPDYDDLVASNTEARRVAELIIK